MAMRANHASVLLGERLFIDVDNHCAASPSCCSHVGGTLRTGVHVSLSQPRKCCCTASHVMEISAGASCSTAPRSSISRSRPSRTSPEQIVRGSFRMVRVLCTLSNFKLLKKEMIQTCPRVCRLYTAPCDVCRQWQHKFPGRARHALMVMLYCADSSIDLLHSTNIFIDLHLSRRVRCRAAHWWPTATSRWQPGRRAHSGEAGVRGLGRHTPGGRRRGDRARQLQWRRRGVCHCRFRHHHGCASERLVITRHINGILQLFGSDFVRFPNAQFPPSAVGCVYSFSLFFLGGFSTSG